MLAHSCTLCPGWSLALDLSAHLLWKPSLAPPPSWLGTSFLPLQLCVRPPTQHSSLVMCLPIKDQCSPRDQELCQAGRGMSQAAAQEALVQSLAPKWQILLNDRN